MKTEHDKYVHMLLALRCSKATERRGLPYVMFVVLKK